MGTRRCISVGPRARFHYTLYYPDLNKSFPVVLCVLMVMLWKDCCFLISHAEKRLPKIETSMHHEDIEQRVAHLHLNVYADDIENRFHKHCFNTKRLHMQENTEQSKDALLSIYNYRKLHRKGKQPREVIGLKSFRVSSLEQTHHFLFFHFLDLVL